MRRINLKTADFGDKIGIWTGGDRSDDVIVRRESAVGYDDREV